MEKNNNNVLIAIILLLIIVIVGVIAYIINDKGIINKLPNDENIENIEDNSSEKNETVEQNLDLNDSLIQQLSRNIMTYDLLTMDLLNDIRKKGSIVSDDINIKLKNYLAYRQIANSDIKSDWCNNYVNVFNPNGNPPYGCSNDYYIGMSYDAVKTNYIEEDILKQAFEKIFGKDSYQKVDYFSIHLSAGYVYDSATARYILGSFQGGGSGPLPTLTLISAKKVGDEIKIVQNAKLEDEYLDESQLFNINVEYNFKLENNNYIFVSASVVS